MPEYITFTYLFIDAEGRKIEPVEGWSDKRAPAGRLTRAVVQQAHEQGTLDESDTEDYVLYVKASDNATLAELGVKDGDTVILAPSYLRKPSDIGGLGPRPSSGDR